MGDDDKLPQIYDAITFSSGKPLLLLIPLFFFSLPTVLLYLLLGPWAAVAFLTVAFLLPRLLWQSSRSAEGTLFTLANLIYWNLVYPAFFGSPFLVAAIAALRPRVTVPLVLCYVVFIKAVSRPDLKSGAAWKFFSCHDWGIVALRRYLRLKLHVSKSLQQRSPEKPVVVGIHPHGSASDYRVAMDGLLYEALPGREVLTLAASVLFSLPLVRELVLWTRCIDASKKVAKRALDRGLSLAVIPGGEAEQMRTRTGIEEVFIRKRLGFVKLAMQHGAALVPCYAFGTVDLYDITDSQYHANAKGFLWTLSRKFGVAAPRYQGAFGFLPKRGAVDLVFGEPLEVPCKTPKQPTDEELAAAHQLYCTKLKELFDKHKGALGYGDRELIMS